jgi:ketosteroid isomerase-like protein
VSASVVQASVVQAFFDALRSGNPAALAAHLSDEVVVVEPSSLPYGGTTTSRDAFFEKVLGWVDQRASFRLETAEVFGDGERLAGHFTATLTARGNGETFFLNQAELYDVTDGVISNIEVFPHDTPGLIEFFDRNRPTS